MKNKFKLHAPILSVVLSLLAVGYSFAANVVVIPLGANETPSGMVAFFKTTECPTGWEKYTEANSRFIRSTTAGPAVGQTGGSSGHNHRWSEWNYNSNTKWESFDSSGTYIDMVDWGDGMNSDGTGYYPIAPATGDAGSRKIYYTNKDFSLPPYIYLLPCAKV